MAYPLPRTVIIDGLPKSDKWVQGDVALIALREGEVELFRITRSPIGSRILSVRHAYGTGEDLTQLRGKFMAVNGEVTVDHPSIPREVLTGNAEGYGVVWAIQADRIEEERGIFVVMPDIYVCTEPNSP